MAVALTAVAPGSSRAEEHPLVAQARRAADRAEFEVGLATLAELPEELALSPSDLRAALLLRASLAAALEDVEASERDLALVSRFTVPEDLPEDLPPSIRARVAAHRATAAPVFVEAEVTVGAEGAALALRHSEPDELVLRPRVFVRRESASSWVELHVEGEEVEMPGDEPFEFYVELVGLGGAVLARSGSREEPRHADPREPPGRSGDGAAPRLPLWPFLVGAAVVAIALGVGLGVGLGAPQEDRVQLDAPVVIW